MLNFELILMDVNICIFSNAKIFFVSEYYCSMSRKIGYRDFDGNAEVKRELHINEFKDYECLSEYSDK